MTKRPCVLVLAGADPSGGAGIAADMAAISALGGHALPVITALTVQDNDRVFSVHPVDTALVQRQAQVLCDKIAIAAIKIGIVGNRANAEAIAHLITELKTRQVHLPVVLDPVLASGHGDALTTENALRAMAPLLAVATLMTPNLPEATALCAGETRLEAQAARLLQQCPHVLIKGGHADGTAKIVNHWFANEASRHWEWPRLAGEFHGSGCTLAAAIAALLAQGKTMLDAIALGQDYCQRALAASYAIAAGQRIPNRSILLEEEL